MALTDLIALQGSLSATAEETLSVTAIETGARRRAAE
jgi:hypothetical protein